MASDTTYEGKLLVAADGSADEPNRCDVLFRKVSHLTGCSHTLSSRLCPESGRCTDLNKNWVNRPFAFGCLVCTNPWQQHGSTFRSLTCKVIELAHFPSRKRVKKGGSLSPQEYLRSHIPITGEMCNSICVLVQY